MKYLRLKKKKEITRILKTGKRAFSGSLTVVYFPAERTKMAVCVGKKFGKSVKRNRIKRLLREVFRGYAESICPKGAFLLIPKERESYSYGVFRRDLEFILKKERLLENQTA